MKYSKIISAMLAAFAASLYLTAGAADDSSLTRTEAKDLKTQSEAQYKARKKVTEANEDLNKADCKTALEGAAKRACEKSAKAAARSHKADAKTVHEVEEQAIKDGKK